MTSFVEIEPHHRTWALHRIVLATMGAFVAALTVVLWAHPTLGYARDGILAGADFRGMLTFMLWATFAGVAIVATAGVAAAKRLTARRTVAVAVPWAVALALLALVLALLSLFG